LEDQTIRLLLAENSANMPEAGAPDLAVGVDFVLNVLRIVLRAVEPAQERRVAASGRLVIHSVPLADEDVVLVALSEVRSRPVVAEALAHGAALVGRAPAGNLVVLNRVTALVIDDRR